MLQRVRFAQAALLAIVAPGFVFSVAVNWPGHLSYDSLIQVAEGRSRAYSFWHPAVMSWMLGIFDGVLPGTGLFVVFDAALVYGALVLALSLPKQASWTGVGVATLCVLTPQFLLYPGIVWKDVLFSGASALGFLLIALAAERWSNLKLRITVIAVALLSLSLGALTRQNGTVVLPLAAFAIGWIAWKRSTTISERPWSGRSSRGTLNPECGSREPWPGFGLCGDTFRRAGNVCPGFWRGRARPSRPRRAARR